MLNILKCKNCSVLFLQLEFFINKLSKVIGDFKTSDIEYINEYP